MFILFVTPFFTENARKWIDTIAQLPESQNRFLRLGVISQERQEVLPPALQHKITAHYRVDDGLDTEQLFWAARELIKKNGPVSKVLAVNEQAQVPIAELRERLHLSQSVAGMSREIALNFRDKARMKERFRASGVPCARHVAATSAAQALAFAEMVGYPVCAKPIAGAATESTFRVDNADLLLGVLHASGVSPHTPLQIEEFVTGDEASLETMSLGGKHMWHSLTKYTPTPLDAVRNPWIQWRVLLPREVNDAQFDDIRAVGKQALDALGMHTGLSHMEWFRRKDTVGSIAISEVAARPPGAQIVTLNCRAHDIDLYTLWARLMIFDEFVPPPKTKYAAGAAFLRGLGAGRVKAVHGLEDVLYELRDLVTDLRKPEIGQLAATSYEGEGFVLVRHPETREVEKALEYIVSKVRVELVG